MPGAPTGTVFNGGTGFAVTKNGVSGAARFLFASEDGTISGWNPTVPAAGSTEAIVGADRSKQHAIYKGLAIATVDGADYLYATDFHHGRVDVFDSTFDAPVVASTRFKDRAPAARLRPVRDPGHRTA